MYREDAQTIANISQLIECAETGNQYSRPTVAVALYDMPQSCEGAHAEGKGRAGYYVIGEYGQLFCIACELRYIHEMVEHLIEFKSDVINTAARLNLLLTGK
jgi:hypothetical protein